ncbi:MAG: BREX system Lon protease-like protein BrxL [Bacillota bacterium]|nr:BREX system Lon protease-like protein BrxL [Bacillota bacterium]
MSVLDDKINQVFPGLVVRKDLVKTVKGNAIVPTYVLEYLLGQYCATNDETTIQAGIETVKEILRKHYVHRSEAGLVRSNIRERGRYKVIDKISVSLNDKRDVYEATFANLGISRVLVDTNTIKQHPKLLVSGIWCIADLEYEYSDDKSVCPWVLASLKPIQMSHFDFDRYTQARAQFTADEWIDLLIQSIGFDPERFSKRSKLIQLTRLIPFCERNYNLIELGPKGTGKSHIYSEFSPHGILLSGGEVTVPKLFVNNSNGKIGLVGYWDTVAFDEFAGRKKRADKALVDILKNYLANKTFSRGIEPLGAEASMAFVGNTQHTVPYMLKHGDLFDELPDHYHDSAFLDRLHFYIPGWEVDIIRGELFSNGYGFVVDYLAEILRYMRSLDYSNKYQHLYTLSPDISTRDRDGINKTFSGLMKILFPDGKASDTEIEEILRFAIEGRKRVKDQLLRIDSTFFKVSFSYENQAGQTKSVSTLEERQYPKFYDRSRSDDDESGSESDTLDQATDRDTSGDGGSAVDVEAGDGAASSTRPTAPALEEKHIIIEENQKGVTFDDLFGPYLQGASNITITDPYIRKTYQGRNLMELIETIIKFKPEEDEVSVQLITAKDHHYDADQQVAMYESIQETCQAAGINFTWEFDVTDSLHARHIVTDQGWKMSLDRGLDVFQQYDTNGGLSLANRMQQYRQCKAFEVTYLRV